MKLGESLIESSNPPFYGPGNAGDSKHRVDMGQSAITGAIGAMCPALREGK